MNVRADMPPNLRDEMESWYDYRYRANTLGEIQMFFTGIYLFCLGFGVDDVLASIKNRILQLNNLHSEIKDQDDTSNTIDGILIRLTILEYYIKLDVKMHQVMFSTAKHIIVAVLHIVSSLILMKATEPETPKLRAIMFCKWAKLLSYVFFVIDVVAFTSESGKWDIVAVFIAFRFVFNFSVKGCLQTIESLSPPPPGHL